MPSRFDGEWLRANFPAVARSMDKSIDKITEETHGEVIGDLDVVGAFAASLNWRAIRSPFRRPFRRRRAAWQASASSALRPPSPRW